ncbi:MAG: hypothetical protein ACJ8G7_11215 [Rhizobacter sp.]
MHSIEITSKRLCLAAMALLAACSSPMPEPPGGPRAGSVAATGALPSPAAARSWSDLRVQAARRMVAANPSGTYTGNVPDVLLAIPVLEIELNGDGSVRRIDVLRRPGQAPETLQMAIDAVRRAAPFGDVSRLPKPWKFSETFLFNDDRKFKPRTLDN